MSARIVSGTYAPDRRRGRVRNSVRSPVHPVRVERERCPELCPDAIPDTIPTLGGWLSGTPGRLGGELLGESGIGKGTKSPTLGDLGLDDHQSSRWQTIARIPAERFEGYIAVPFSERGGSSAARFSTPHPPENLWGTRNSQHPGLLPRWRRHIGRSFLGVPIPFEQRTHARNGPPGPRRSLPLRPADIHATVRGRRIAGGYCGQYPGPPRVDPVGLLSAFFPTPPFSEAAQ